MNSAIFHLPFSPLDPTADEQSPRSSDSELPKNYGRDRLVMLPRDPHWLWLYWEITPATLASLPKSSGADQAQPTIRLFASSNNRLALEISCSLDSRNFYIKAPLSGETYYAELGLKRSRDSFSPILKSNTVTLPYGYPADKRAIDEEPFGSSAPSSTSRVHTTGTLKP